MCSIHFRLKDKMSVRPHGERLEVFSGRSVTLDEIPVKYIIDVVDEKNEYKPFITTWDYEQENIEVAL